ncbi:ATP-dependent bile acid permease [Vanrija pseudolonga]|uniref:ATP-dependent bile acid permease n=1 Tax=Vanrija pseudolonga TaxID=143232 RepID=A0AAF1BP25_9TREE|nr:ATP-dependent bile acid permease [Vanrija pseudolonga]
MALFSALDAQSAPTAPTSPISYDTLALARLGSVGAIALTVAVYHIPPVRRFVDYWLADALTLADVPSDVDDKEARKKAAAYQPSPALGYALVILNALAVGVWTVSFGDELSRLVNRALGSREAVVYAAVMVLIWSLLLIRTALHPPVVPPWSSFTVYTVLFGVSFTILMTAAYTRVADGQLPVWATATVLVLESTNAAITLLLASIIGLLRFNTPLTIGRASVIAPDDVVSLTEWLTFSWVTPLIKQAANETMQPEDLPPLSTTMRTKQVFQLFIETKAPTLFFKIVYANRFDLIVDGALTFVAAVFSYMSPYFFQRILSSIQIRENPYASPDLKTQATAHAYAFVVLTFFAGLGKTLADLIHLWHSRRASLRIYSQLTAAIYEKALKRKDTSGVVGEKAGEEDDDKKEGGTAEAGKVVNLMASDANRISGTAASMTFIWSSPIEAVIATVFLYQLLGWSAFAGILALVLAMPLNSILMKRNIKIQKDLLKARDKRISVMSELINAITFFAWTEKWKTRVTNARKEEMRQLVRSALNGGLFTLIWAFLPILVTLSAFFSFIVIEKRELTVDIAFPAILLFQMLRQPLTGFPMFVIWFMQTMVSVKRIDDFLKEDEVPDWVSSLKREEKNLPLDETKIGFEAATLRFNTAKKETKDDKKNDAPTNGASATPPPTIVTEDGDNGSAEVPEEETVFELTNLNVNFPIGKLTIVAGPTGAGKSALLKALLGELDLIEGKTFLPKNVTDVDPSTGLRNSVAYAAQTPWLQQKSIKDNILFGEELNEDRYDAVVEACALTPDFDILEDGDQTEIGDKGVSLSGGQKARVALARAVYSFTKHVLLDDPLAAVDSHTAKHLTEKCINGPLLRGRTVILVSHHVELLLPASDYLVRIVDGRVDAQGTPEDLRSRGELEGIVAIEEAECAAVDTVQPEDVEIIVKSAEGDDKKQDKKEKKKGPGRKLVKDEERAVGNVKWGTYLLYIRAATYITWIISLIVMIFGQVSSFAEQLWIKFWGDAYPPSKVSLFALVNPLNHLDQQNAEYRAPTFYHHIAPAAVNATKHLFTIQAGGGDVSANWSPPHPPADTHPAYYLTVYAVLMFITAFAGFVLSMVGVWGAYRASITLHDRLLDSIMHATVRFFSTTPLGRIINRFSKDIETVDNSLYGSLRIVLVQVVALFVSVGVIAYYIPWFIFPAAVILYFYYLYSVVYLKAGRNVRRIQATTRSPIFSGFAEILDGVVSVRAFSAEKRFFDNLCKAFDITQTAYYYVWMNNRWLLLRFDVLGSLTVLGSSILALSGAVSAGSTGIIILRAQGFVSSCYWMSRFWAQLEIDFNSVERVEEYLRVPQEPPSEIAGSRPPAYWPSNTPNDSFVSARDVEIKYSPELPTVFKGSFDIKAGEKIGLIGRTGSGKSTIAMSLLRFVDPTSGTLEIDGIDITKIGVDDLRSRITYIPQDAVLFSGTVRDNLDPFSEHTDEELLEALARVNLVTGGRTAAGTAVGTPAISRQGSTRNLAALAALNSAAAHGAVVPHHSTTDSVDSAAATIVPSARVKITLNSEVSAGGNNFSQGQRQLIAMARALLRRSNLIIMDEATASVDFATDEALQAAIRSEFKESTLITIAHRLSSVIDYDRLLVLADGGVAEFDTPINLLRQDTSLFKTLCEKTGKFKDLYAAAEQKEKKDAAAK